MMNIVYIFWMYVVIFAVIGAARGWAKELLVSFSVILALAVIHVLERYIPLVQSIDKADVSLFWVRSIILIVLVFFGYQTVVSIPHLASRAARERLQDTLFGGILGGVNGYLIAGTILYYLVAANYPYQKIISPPTDPAYCANRQPDDVIHAAAVIGRTRNLLRYHPCFYLCVGRVHLIAKG